MVSPEDFTIGWICALEIELVAATGMLDEKFQSKDLPRSENDPMIYTVGRIDRHLVVLTCLREAGTTAAATAALYMRAAFPRIRTGLMVGIGGGVPSEKHDIRLGDIVVSKPQKGNAGVFQYDRGKIENEGEFVSTGLLQPPPSLLLNVVHQLSVNDTIEEGNKIQDHINSMFTSHQKLRSKFVRPPPEKDILFKSDYSHKDRNSPCHEVCKVTEENLQHRPNRIGTKPLVHYGQIASGNAVIKDGKTRDRLAEKNDLLCFEMEAAGLMDDFPCLVIRGISDYSDSHKNDIWHPWAALVAAAYAKELLSTMPRLSSRSTNRIDSLSQGMFLVVIAVTIERSL